jgi:hypothetical protein
MSRAELPPPLSVPAFQTASLASAFHMRELADCVIVTTCWQPIAALGVAFAWTLLTALPNARVGGASLVVHALSEALVVDARAGAETLRVQTFAAAVDRTFVVHVTTTVAVISVVQVAVSAPPNASALVAVPFVAHANPKDILMTSFDSGKLGNMYTIVARGSFANMFPAREKKKFAALYQNLFCILIKV